MSTRRVIAFTALLLVGFLVILSQTNRVWANGTETLGNPNIAIQQGTGIVSGGTGLFISQPGTIIVNIPFGATIKQVLLYWEGQSKSINNTNCNGVTGDNNIIIEGNVVQSVPAQGIGGPTFLPTPKSCIFSFRADITSLDLVQDGPNSLSVSGLTFNVANNGAGIVVIFDQGVESVEFSGEATVLDASSTIVGANFAVTQVTAGPLPPEGGSDSDSANQLSVPGVITSGTATASTTGAGNQSFSEAEVQNLGITLLTILGLNASLVRAEAEATCDDAGDAIVTGDSQILDLTTTLGVNIPATFPPDTVLVNVGGIQIVANQQIVNDQGSFAEITVNALHITVTALGATVVDIVISSAHADIECETVDPAQVPLQIKDGSDFAVNTLGGALNGTVRQRFNFSATDFHRTAIVTLFIADCDVGRPDLIRIRTLSLGPTVVLTNEPFADLCASSDGARWDTLTIPVEIPAGAERVDVQVFSKKGPGSKLTTQPDSLIWVVAALSGPTADGNLFSGRATVARASVLNVDQLAMADTGDLPPSGGSLEETVVDASFPPIISNITGSAKTMGAGDMSNSEAIVEDLDLDVGNASAAADLIQATAEAQCDNGNASVTGDSLLANVALTVLGNPINIPADPQPNTVVTLGLIRVVFNEQIATDTNGTAEITVNAVHITVGQVGDLPPLLDIVLASAHADIACGGPN